MIGRLAEPTFRKIIHSRRPQTAQHPFPYRKGLRMKRLALVLPFLASAAFAQYDDYPVGEYTYRHHRVVVSPLKVFGGMDATKRDEGPKVDLVWVPGIDIQEIRYEFVDGPQGTFGWGPYANAYLGLDSLIS